MTKAATNQIASEQVFQESVLTNVNTSSIPPPDFMLDLHRVYNEDKNFMVTQSKLQGDTIRSFFPYFVGYVSCYHIEKDWVRKAMRQTMLSAIKKQFFCVCRILFSIRIS